MAQRLYLIKKDKYRLKMRAYDNVLFDEIKESNSPHGYALSIKEKLSEESLERFVSKSDGSCVYFDLCSLVTFGTYLYVIELTDFSGKRIEDLAYGFIDVLPDA
jgi:hypothetical protein